MTLSELGGARHHPRFEATARHCIHETALRRVRRAERAARVLEVNRLRPSRPVRPAGRPLALHRRSRVHRTLAISCEAVPASMLAARARGGTCPPCILCRPYHGAAESFVSFIALLGGVVSPILRASKDASSAPQCCDTAPRARKDRAGAARAASQAPRTPHGRNAPPPLPFAFILKRRPRSRRHSRNGASPRTLGTPS